jgi:hypothetical protein
MTVPIYAVAMVVVLTTCFSSDIQQERPKHIMAVAGLSVVSLAIVAGVQTDPKVRYTFLAFGKYTISRRLALGSSSELKIRRIRHLGLQSHDAKLSFQHHRTTSGEASRQYRYRQVSPVA